MTNRIVDFSVRHRTLVLLAACAACVAGWFSLKAIPVDAIPDLSETQVIIYSQWDRSPDLVEDQITYPLVTAMLGAPRVKTVRGYSDFGYSWVYVIFDEGTDLYWARSRTLEYLSAALSRLPEGSKTELGPDATSVGWIFQYALVDTTGKLSLADLRSYQDWRLRYYLQSVPGVAEVAPIGGFERQYQVNVDPARLSTFRIPINRVVEAVRGANYESTGRVLDFGGTEYMVRGRGYANSVADLENVALTAGGQGSPIRIRDIGRVSVGPDMRRGIAELDGAGEVVSGVVIMRSGEDALQVIDRVKARIRQAERGFPPGVRVVPVYDRSELIRRSVHTVRSAIVQAIATVVFIILIFLWHLPSAVVPIVTMPIAVLMSFVFFRLTGISANIMSLSGVALAFSELVDASIVVVEHTQKRIASFESSGRPFDRSIVARDALKEVTGPVFFALLVMAVSFLPILTLQAEEGRMYIPLAYTKSLTMAVAAVVTITVVPALLMAITRRKSFSAAPLRIRRALDRLLTGTGISEDRHPISRWMTRVYEPVVRWTLRHRTFVIAGATAIVLITAPVLYRLGSEPMPPLDEGTILYMPSTLPGVSITQAAQLLQITDHTIRQFPEVDHVLGKAGRAETATDPAPLSMLETVITLKPRETWPRRHTWYSSWCPEWARPALRHLTSDAIPTKELIAQMDAAIRIPGLTNSWTMPIRGRIDMLSTGVRTPLGLKITGSDTREIERIGSAVEAALATVKGTRSVLSERAGEGHFLDIIWNRDELSRYGISMEDAQKVVQNAIGGENVTTIVRGLERYPVNVRYQRDFRSDPGALARIPVQAGGDVQVPLGTLARIQFASAPAMIRNEDGLLTGYVYIDVADVDPETYVRNADQVLRSQITLPAGFAMQWSGQYEAMARLKQRLRLILPLTIALIAILLFFNTGSAVKTGIVLLALPFSAVGAIWFVYLAGYNMSAAVWVGLIALLGIDAETGVFMLLYLDLALKEAQRHNRLRTIADLREAIAEGAARRLRPKFMTFATTFIGLVPIMWATGTGSDVMKRIAAPIAGGIITSFILELLVYPAVYEAWKSRSMLHAVEPHIIDVRLPEHPVVAAHGAD